MSFPGFDNLFGLSEGRGTNRAFRAENQESIDWYSISSGAEPPPAAARFRWFMGAAKPSPIVWTGNLYPMLIHASVAEDLETAGATGWSAYPVELSDRTGRLHPNYAGLVIHGRCGLRDLTKSSIELRELPGGHFPQFVGFYFDPSTWDGSDLFVPEGTFHKLATRPVADVLTKHGARDILATPLVENRTSATVFEGGPSRTLLPADFLSRLAAVYEAEGKEVPDRYRGPGAI